MKYKYILPILLLLTILTSIASAAPAKNETFGKGSLNDIIDRKEMIKAANAAWDGGLSTPGYIVIGIVIVAAIVVIVVGVFGGGAQMVAGRFTGNNDEHAKGKSMIGVAVGSAILIIVSLVIVGLVFAAW